MIDVTQLRLMEGDLPAKGLAMALEWTRTYQADLLDIWNTQNFRKLPPLQ